MDEKLLMVVLKNLKLKTLSFSMIFELIQVELIVENLTFIKTSSAGAG